MTPYRLDKLEPEEEQQLLDIYNALLALSSCDVPSVRSSARAAVAHIAQALNGQGLVYDLYTNTWND